MHVRADFERLRIGRLNVEADLNAISRDQFNQRGARRHNLTFLHIYFAYHAARFRFQLVLFTDAALREAVAPELGRLRRLAGLREFDICRQVLRQPLLGLFEVNFAVGDGVPCFLQSH